MGLALCVVLESCKVVDLVASFLFLAADLALELLLLGVEGVSEARGKGGGKGGAKTKEINLQIRPA